MNNLFVQNSPFSAWGNILTKSGTLADINPFRYRSYYMDDETGFYYLNTRYYDSEIRRFINADNYELLSELASVIGQVNLYNYCNNNPIMFTDSTGHFPVLITLILGGFAIAGGAIGGKVAYDKAVADGKSGADLFWATVGGVFVGASTGLAVGGLIVATGGAIYGAIQGISAIVPFVGLTAIKTFAIGALAFNQFAFITAPKHPYGGIIYQWSLAYNRNVYDMINF